jgi:putative endonuclease
MFYVYQLQSVSRPEQLYIGFTEDLRTRLASHNRGESAHTRKFVPWCLVSYQAFKDKGIALEFEAYLKSGSGRAFAKKRLWPERKNE